MNSAALAVGGGEGERRTTATNAAESTAALRPTQEFEVCTNAAECNSAAQPSTNAAEKSAAPNTSKDLNANAADNRGTRKRTSLRSDAAQKALLVTEALADFARAERIPEFAVSITQGRLAELLGLDKKRHADRCRVHRWLGYAADIGLITIIEPGRQRPKGNGIGIPALYSINLAAYDGELEILSPEQQQCLRDAAEIKICDSRRTHERVAHYRAYVKIFDEAFPNVAGRKSRRKGNAPRGAAPEKTGTTP